MSSSTESRHNALQPEMVDMDLVDKRLESLQLFDYAASDDNHSSRRMTHSSSTSLASSCTSSSTTTTTTNTNTSSSTGGKKKYPLTRSKSDGFIAMLTQSSSMNDIHNITVRFLNH